MLSASGNVTASEASAVWLLRPNLFSDALVYDTDLSRYGLGDGYTNMNRPAAAHSDDLSKKHKPGRLPRMEPALKKNRSDDEEIL
jgi:hypothetical protein